MVLVVIILTLFLFYSLKPHWDKNFPYRAAIEGTSTSTSSR
jgi:hypothetical protein